MKHKSKASVPSHADLVEIQRAWHSPGKHVASVGIELEGGMDHSDLKKLVRYLDDNGLNVYYSKGEEPGLRVKSKNIPNAEIRFWNRQFAVAKDFIRYVYDDCDFKTNDNCGFHVHVRFSDMPQAVSIFSSPTVINSFVGLYKKEFRARRYRDRLHSMYCFDLDNVTMVLAQSGPELIYEKRTRINLGAYIEHGTIKFRIMPNQLSSAEAIKSLEWVVSTSESLYARNLGRIVKDAKVSPQIAMDHFFMVREAPQERLAVAVDLCSRD
ncbi:MAG: hypothetical protein KGH64_05135 [Candidatus Micrarchaeota archaeon]|nr:hypothetical protein [Candidatus Micrarchaeota archaeon]MDE1834694.1 hypothetical protein [Candidatus Micrarchaeota archaeon]